MNTHCSSRQGKNDPEGDSEINRATPMVSIGQTASNQSHETETPIHQSPGGMTLAWKSCSMGEALAMTHSVGGTHAGDIATPLGLEGRTLSQRKISSCLKI